MKATFDIGIVGLGAVGSAALYHAATRGLQAVGFDQFKPPHTLGSSHGGSRIIRRAYFEGASYVPLLSHAYELWQDVERASGRSLMHLNGCLTVGQRDGSTLRGAKESSEAYGIPFQFLEPADVHERFPAFRLRDDEAALWEPEAGWLEPELCIRTHLELAEEAGAEIRLNEAVKTWGATGGKIRIETAGGTFDVGRLVLCAGGWIVPLLREVHVPLRIERQVNAWFRPSGAIEKFKPENCPVYIWEYDGRRVLYGFPDTGDGVKTGLHHSGEFVEHPDDVDREVHDDDVEALRRQTERLLPGSCGGVARVSTCFYTNTPDDHYLIDHHPGLERVVFASACSGHGFKASNAVGESLVRLACGEDPAVDLSAFRLKRFR